MRGNAAARDSGGRRGRNRRSRRNGCAVRWRVPAGRELTIHEQVTWDRDGVTTATGKPIRFWIDNVPEIETVLIERPGMPFLGAGEAVLGPRALRSRLSTTAPPRLRRMPFTPEAIRAAAMTLT